MAFFKFGQRPPGGGKEGAEATAPSVEVLRRRARHRLIGAAILVLAAVVTFPMIFDAPPRPVDVDVPIVIPDRNGPSRAVTAPVTELPGAAPVAPAAPAAAPVVAPASPGTPVPKTAEPAAPAAKPAEPKAAAIQAPEPKVPEAKAPESKAPEAKAEPKAAAKPEPKVEPKPEAKAEPKPEPKADTQPAASAKPEPRAAAASEPATARYVVQVGAFADAAKVREVRASVERAGLKTYTQDVTTGEGKRTRVRIGPFATKAEAEKVVARLKTLKLAAAVLLL